MQIYLTVFVTLFSVHAVEIFAFNVLSDEFIKQINLKQLSWKAGMNFHQNRFISSSINKLANSVSSPDHFLQKLNVKKVSDDANETVIPTSFDAREKWSNCKSIGKVLDQGACSSSWAIGAVSAMSDRICIHSNATIQADLSAQDLLSCCPRCRFDCDAGWPLFAWNHWNQSGIVSGGTYDSAEGCKSYLVQPCSHYNNTNSNLTLCSNMTSYGIPECSKSCDANSSLSYDRDLHFGLEPYRIFPNETELKLEIMTNGPVQTIFNIYGDFLTYKSGVYVTAINETTNATVSDFLGESTAKVIGWGTENNQSYWLAINTWGTEWGDNGVFKFLIGQNQDDIVTQAMAALPNFDVNSTTLYT